jgi:hypothetical protein
MNAARHVKFGQKQAINMPVPNVCKMPSTVMSKNSEAAQFLGHMRKF